MRVAYVHPFTQHLSGPDESLLALLAPLREAGVEAHLVIPRLGPLVPRYRELGATVHVQALTILQRAMTPTDVILCGPRMLARSVSLAGLLRRIDADLVHTNMEVVFEGGLAARRIGIPHVMHYRGNSLDSPRTLFDVLTFAWTTLADRIFCISEATAQIFRRRKRDAHVEVLYNPIALRTFLKETRSDVVRASLGALPENPLVVTMGRIHPRKDMATFIRACAKVAQVRPDARFAIVGAAEAPSEVKYHQELLGLTRTLGLNDRLKFAGLRSDVAGVMKAADVFVLASRHEGFGRVLAEAMAAGTAVVASREGALPELIAEPAYGLGAIPGDDVDFKDRILTLLDDDTQRHQMGRAASERARLFDADSVAQRVRHCYENLLSARA